MQETWKQVAEAPAYEVSNRAQIRRRDLDRCGRQPKILKQAVNSTGRAQVSLCVDDRIYSQAIHRIVARAFLGAPPPGKTMVCHKDGNPLNNVPSNLYYGDATDNGRDAMVHGTTCSGSRNGNAVLTENQIGIILSSPKSGYRLAKEMGVSNSTICRVRARHKPTRVLIQPN